MLLEAGLDPDAMGARVFYEGKGCLECDGTGFHGRMAIAELLDLSDRIRGLILERRPAADIKRAAKEEGMTFLRDAALAKVFEGLDDPEGDQQGDLCRVGGPWSFVLGPSSGTPRTRTGDQGPGTSDRLAQ